jgi:hypothetical protein
MTPGLIEERGWTVVRATVPTGASGAARRGVRAWRPVLTAGTLVAVVLGVAFTPPGEAVADLLRRAISEPSAAPPPLSPVRGAKLPGGGGALLASGRNGPVVVRNVAATDRLLGAVDEAAWSPRGRFVVAVRGPEVIAVDRSGRRRWSVVAPGPARHPRWSPDGFRVAYVAARRLRVVAGDGCVSSRGTAPATGRSHASARPSRRPGVRAPRRGVTSWPTSIPAAASPFVTPIAAPGSGSPGSAGG